MHLLRSDTKLELQLAQGPQPIWGNADRLQQAIINLTTNDHDALEGPGVVVIETCRCTAKDLTERGVEGAPTSSEYVLLAVSDSRGGMSREIRDLAIDRFFDQTESGHGVGAVPSIAKAVATRADGHVRFQCQPGVGARLECYWPLAI